MKRYLLLTLCCLSNCISMPNYGLATSAQSSDNVNNLSRIERGMSQKEILCIMRRPFRSESIEIESDVYDVWFYITKPTVLGQSRMVPQNLTPLTFKNGALVAWGYDMYHFLLKKKDIHEKTQPPSAEEEEDRRIEKALKTTSFAMSSCSRNNPLPPEDDEEASSNEKGCKPPLREEDEEMIEEENEQNFNFW